MLSVNDLQVRDDRRQLIVEGATFEVRAGEILGVAGVEGNGQRELVEAITGIRPIVSTELGHHRRARRSSTSHAQVREMGAAYIPEDRERDGLVGGYTIADNLVLTHYYEAPVRQPRCAGLRRGRPRRPRLLVERFDVRTPDIHTTVKSLSGGNKQKVIVARELSDDNKLVVASQPTRGVDVGSIEFIHSQLVAARNEGVAVLLVSAELDEIFSLSDRIAVIYEGRIVAERDPATTTSGADRSAHGRWRCAGGARGLTREPARRYTEGRFPCSV